MKINYWLVVVMLAFNLSGCAGYWLSHSATTTTDASNHTMILSGLQGSTQHHPENGSAIYDREARWCGLTLWAVVPIPLMLPVCHSYSEVTFSNDKPIKRVDHYVGGSGYLCGPFVLIPTGMDNGTSHFCSGKFHG